MKKASCIFLYLSACFIFWHCSENIAGGGSETGNGNTIAGVIVNENGEIIQNARVSLYPDNYQAYQEDSLPETWQTLTDEQGTYRLPNITSGSYNIVTRHPDKPLSSLLQNLLVNTTDLNKLIQVDTTILKKSGTIKVTIPDSLNIPDAYFYIPGTDVSVHIDSAGLKNKTIELNSVPAAIYQDIRFSKNRETDTTTTVFENITVLSDSTIHISRYYQWECHITGTINTKATGANIQEHVTNFPLLLRLDTSSSFAAHSLFSCAQPDGSDLRITNTHDKPLPYEIEQWNKESGIAHVWVKLDTVYGNNNTQSIHLYTGNTNATDRSDESVTFDSSTQYAGVWHFDSVSSTRVNDASTAENNAIPLEQIAGNSIPGLIGSALYFNGINQRLITPKRFDNPSVFSLSLWLKTDIAGGRLITFERDSLESVLYSNDRLIFMGDSGHLNFGVFPPEPDSISSEDSLLIGPADSTGKSPGIRRAISTPEKYNDGNWHQVVATLSPTEGQSLYIDGTLIVRDSTVKQAENFSGFWKIGGGYNTYWENGPTNPYFNGIMDEVRVKQTAVSEAWIKLDYECQKQGSSVVQFK
ncbi:MAG: DUF2341 domain-containing protein [Fibrobacteria bacterium]|nr:DUF2341 domain-containing protein [Fibrobacteria bacterium]